MHKIVIQFVQYNNLMSNRHRYKENYVILFLDKIVCAGKLSESEFSKNVFLLQRAAAVCIMTSK